jgi:hypothetical protein
MQVAAGSSLPSERREMADRALALWKLQAIDIESLYKILISAGYNLPEGAEVKDKLMAQAQAMQGVK